MVLDLQIPQEKRWEEFVVIYSPLLRYWIRQKNVPLSAVEDVLQESLRSVYVGIGQFHRRKFSTGSFRGWLRIIVNRRVADYFRQSPREENLSSESLGNLDARPDRDPEEIATEERALRELEARALTLIRNSTAEQTWKMFWLSTVEQVPNSEIADQFGVTTAAVRVAKARVISRLRRLFVDAASESE
jgi:RNA polymerase sigma factor (sigma-70 family)